MSCRLKGSGKLMSEYGRGNAGFPWPIPHIDRPSKVVVGIVASAVGVGRQGESFELAVYGIAGGSCTLIGDEGGQEHGALA